MLSAKKIVNFLVDYKLACSLEAADYLYGDTEIKSGRVLLLGKQEQPAQYLQAMDVFLLPSLYEGFGIVNIEAQASGLPCVVSSAVPESASVNSNFYRLLLSDGVEKWSDFITSLSFERLPYGSAEKIKKAGFDIEDSARKLRTIYQKLAK